MMMAHPADPDDGALGSASEELGRTQATDALNDVLRPASLGRSERIEEALDVLANAYVVDREEAWR